MAINIQELSKDPVAWKKMVDEAFVRSGATNQLAQGWREAMYKLPEMLNKPLPTGATGVDLDTKRDWDEYYGQYQTSLADIQSAIAGGAKLEELGGGAKLMDWGYSNINQLLTERKGTETAGILGGQDSLSVTGQAPQSFADIRAGGDPNDLITIEKNGKQRQVSRSALSDSFATAGFKIVGEAGKQLQFGAEQAPSVPFISGLSGQQQDSINTLIGTGRAFNETDAKNFAYATGQADHKQFIGKTGQQALTGLNKPKTALAETMGQPPSQITADMVAGEPVDLAGLFGGSSTSVQLSHILNIGGSSIDNAIMNFFAKQQELASKQLAIAEEQQAGLQEQLVGAMTTSTQDALNAVLEQFQITQKMQALNDIKEQMLKKQEALSLGVQQEEDRIAPMTIIGRRQQKLRDQTAGELSALAVAGQVLQDDLTMAQALADMSFQAMQQDKQNQISAFEFLLSMNNQEVIRLRADEKEAINTQISLIREQVAKAEANQDQVFSMIASNPIAAQKGGVSFTDTREEALVKMTPYLGTEKEPLTKTLGKTLYQYNYDTGGWDVVAKEAYAGGGGGGRTSTEKPMSTNQIEQFRRSYGWTPPFGFSQSQLLKYMEDNPNATPEELAAGASQAIETTGTDENKSSGQFLNVDYLKNKYSKSELKDMSDKFGTSKWYTFAGADINRFFDAIQTKIEEARQQGYSDSEIEEYLIG